MELDDLKNTWALYDKKLNDSLKLNEKLLRKLNLGNSKREMNVPFIYEIVTIIIGGIGLLFFVPATIKFSGEFKFFISGLLTSLIISFALVLSIKKVRLMSNIDYYNDSIIDLQKSITKLKQKFLQYKKIELLGGLFLAIVLSPILVKAIRNIDVYANPWRYILGTIIGLGIGYPIGFWMYKNLYEKKIKNTEQFLKEIERFEDGEQSFVN